MKFCKDCKHFYPKTFAEISEQRCYRPGITHISVVTGDLTHKPGVDSSALRQRNREDGCGPGAVHFAPRLWARLMKGASNFEA